MQSAIFFSIGDVDYGSLVGASSYAAAAIYFYSFLFIITIIVMQMVIAIFFGAYDGLREQINESEELSVRPTLMRKILLGREPSIREINVPLVDLLKRQFCRMHPAAVLKALRGQVCFLFSKRRVAPIYPATSGRQLDADNFSDDDLLDLFDAQHVFRVYGILSPALEDEIVLVKKAVAARQAVEEAALGAKPTQTEHEREQSYSEIDPWALNIHEFCALLHALDDHDDQVNVQDSMELHIAQSIFSAYGRRRSSKLQGRASVAQRLEDLNKELGGKLDAVLRALEKDGSFDAKTNSHQTKDNSAETKVDSRSGSDYASSAKNNGGGTSTAVGSSAAATGFFGGSVDRAPLGVSSLRARRRNQSMAILNKKDEAVYMRDFDDQDDLSEEL
jgi:hypothetical protein